MSSRATSKKIENSREGFGNGQDVTNSGHQTTSDKSKVDFIYEAVPSRSKHDIILVLQSCDYNVDAAISIFSQDRADEILNQWSHKGKKNKNVNKKRQNKKKQPTKDAVGNAELETNKTSKIDKDDGVIAEQTLVGKDLSLDLPTSPPSSGPVINGISPTSEHLTHPVKPNKKHSHHTRHHHSSSHHPKHTNDHNRHTSESSTDKLSPTSRNDALKKTTKDLQRSSFSLARYQVVLEEECEQSLKRIAKTFENIRSCIDEREQFLTQALKQFKEEGDKLLQQRLEDAAALKLKTERVHSMSDEQVALLRADIKSFVAERKLDEELAQTKRFLCEEEKMLEDIKTFGQVVPIKGTYTPVVLNHVLTTTVSKATTSSRTTIQTSTTPSTQPPLPTSSRTTIQTSTMPSTKPPLPTSSRTTIQTSTTPSTQPPLPTSSRTTIQTSTMPSTKPPLPTPSHASTNPTRTISADHNKASAVPAVQNSSSVNAQTSQPSSVTTSKAQTVNKSKKPPQHHSAESHYKPSSVESQHTTSETPVSKAVSHQDEQKDRRTSHVPTKAKQRSAPSSKSSSTETKTKERNAHSKSNPKQQVKDLSHTSTDTTTAKLTGPPPKISTLISLAMAKSSAAVSEGSQDSTPKHKETASNAEQKRGGRNHSKDQNRGQRYRPNTAPDHQGKPQQSRESRSNRPQSTRQRRDKENDSKQVNTDNVQQKTGEDKQSEQSHEGRRRRQRRRGKDRKPKEGETTWEDQDKKPRPNRHNEEHKQEENEEDIADKDNTGKYNTEKSQRSEDDEITNKEDTIKTEHISSNNQEENVVSGLEGVSTIENDHEMESNLEVPAQITQEEDATMSQTENGEQEIHKDEERTQSTDLCPSPKKNVIDSHADHTIDERNEVKNDEVQSDGALPQRSLQRRRNREPNVKNECDAIEDHNGSTNGVIHENGHETANGDKESSEGSQKAHEESVSEKLSIACALINGHEVYNGTDESVVSDKHKENKPEVQDLEASSNSAGDDCLVER